MLGISYGVLILLIIIISLNNKNNLIFLFSFFLFSVGITTTLMTNKNIEKIKLNLDPRQYFFQNEKSTVFFTLMNIGKINVYELFFRWSADSKNIGVHTIVQLKKQESVPVLLEHSFSQMGLQQLPEITIESYFPFNFLRVWKYREFSDSQIWVFPEKINLIKELQSEFQDISIENINHYKALNSNEREFAYLDKSPYDSVNRDINWKSFAKTDSLYLNKYEYLQESKNQIEVNWLHTESLKSINKRKSHMSYVIDHLYKQRINLKVIFPQKSFHIAAGSKTDYLSCLIYLTAFEDKPLGVHNLKEVL